VIPVLHVITRLSLGGSSENTVSQVVALDRAGWRCTLAAGMEDSEARSLDDARARGCRLVGVPGLRREVGVCSDLGALASLVRLIRRERPAIVHTHTSKAGFIGRLAARLGGVPAVIHQPHGHIFYGYYGPRQTRLYVALERLAARWTDRIVTLTDLGTEEHLALGIGRRDRFVAVPSGVPTARLRERAPRRDIARARLGISPDAFVVVGVGRLVPIKGFDLLVEAVPAVLAAVPETEVLLVGDGPDRDGLAARAAELGVAARVRFLGTTSDVVLPLAAADVCAAPSRNEGMGRALVEAMALAVPVVGAAVGGIPAVIGDDEAGRLIPSGDAAALAAALVELGQDPGLRMKCADAACARAERFSTAVADARLRALYDDLARVKRLR
jgi:glycosyltransferase involved in cell wall biosynthesis